MDIDIKALEGINIIAWIMANNIKTSQGTPVEFSDHSFMIDPYLDWTPRQGARKAAQCGWSEMTTNKLIWAAFHGIPGYDLPGINVIYTLPTDDFVNSFVPSKTNMIIANNPIMKEFLSQESYRDENNSVQRKRIGNNFVYFRGTQSATAAIAITSELNIHDEADRSNPAVLEMYESRLAHGKYKGTWSFSNPSAPGMPADVLYERGDQKHWFIKCYHCGYWQYLDWVEIQEHEFTKGTNHAWVDMEKKQYICGKCQGELTREMRQRGRWVAKYPGREISSYWVTQMMYPWMAPKELIYLKETKSKSYFMNFVMGKPYVGSDVVVDRQTIINNIVLTEPHWERGKVAMGVDNGDTKHYVIGNLSSEGVPQIFEIGKTRDWDYIELLMKKYAPHTIIDLNPYPDKPRELARKYRNTWCSFYVEETKDYELVKWGDETKKHMVYPARNLTFDELINDIGGGGIKFLHPHAYWEEYITHWESMYRADMIGSKLAEQAPTGVPGQVVRGVWMHTGPDHYAHATNYFYIACQRMRHGNAQIVQSASVNVPDTLRQLGSLKYAPAQVNTMNPHTPTRQAPMRDYLSNVGKNKKTKGIVGGSTSGNI